MCVKFADLGFIADILIGVLVALIIYAINPLTDIFKLFVVTVTAGIGGSAILENYINVKAF